jgi:VanZ family protein
MTAMQSNRTNGGLLESIPLIGYGMSAGLGKREAVAFANRDEHRRGSMSSPDGSLLTHSPTARTNGWLRWGLVAYVILLTYVLLSPDPFGLLSSPSTTPSEPLPLYLAWLKNDKVRHFVAYGVLAGLMLSATRWNPAAVLLAVAVHGGSMEILQPFFPPRTMEWMDFLADVSGAVSVILVHRCLPRRRSD